MLAYLADVTLFDGHAHRTRQGVLIEGDRIAWVGRHARAPRDARGAHELARGLTVTPGLIDAHVHLCFDGSADFAAEAREMPSVAAATVKAVRNAAITLRHGVTTVRDLGGLGDAVIWVGRAVETGRLPGPRILAAGQALTITGGHGHNVAVARQVDGPDGVRRAVREEIRAGASVIKLMATGGVLTPGIAADFAAFTLEELRAAVDEAHAWGRAVAAHAIGAGGILRAVEAGVDSIEHGTMLTPEGARLMKERGTYHVPTLSALLGMVEHPEEVPAYAVEKATALLDRAREALRRSVRAGVRIACGTDAGTPFNPHGSAPLEIVRMVEWGVPAPAALRAATSVAAELLRLPEVGVVRAGAVADLCVYEADPLEDVRAVLAPVTVLKAGEPVGSTL